MPRRSILSATQRESLLALPDTQDELIRRYTLSDSDLAIIRQRRGAANRLGFAVQLCYMRYPGIVLGVGKPPSPPLLHLVAAQLKISVEKWAEYGDRAQTRREHIVELQTLFGFRSFTTNHHRAAVQDLAETALQTDTGIVLAGTVVEKLRAKAILLPRLNAIERICAEAVTRANRLIYRMLTDALSADQSTAAWRHEPDVEEELIWMAGLVVRLRQRPSVQLLRMFHTYLLLLNEYYQLLVQSEAEYGFDQFQKFTLTELREPAERDYRTRFHAMHGPRLATSTVGYLEGRFAPKDDPVKAYTLFKAILGGYLEYLGDVATPGLSLSTAPRSLSELLAALDKYFERPIARHRSIQRLTLVAHFIKQPWSPEQRQAGPYRHYPLDLKLRRTAGVLLSCLARWPRLRYWVRGIDAAANELHAPPDVFAPVFRVCRRAGLTRRTYHAGEDFRHLLSGIATMLEALNLLDLRGGDRIGHGTAMGIRPNLWLDRMPSRLTLSRGEWMLGVLAAWQLLRDVSATQACAYRLQRELEDVAGHIFGRSLTASDVERAMALRGLNRRDIMRQLTREVDLQPEPLSEPWREETEMVRSTYKSQPDDVRLLWKWLSDPGVQARAEALIEKEARFLDAPSYLQLQQALMRQVAERGVLIETLPSSNIRISQYYHVGEHHSLRWMRVPGHVEEGDPEIMVCLGSDDPGIFAGDLETEFYLLYAELRQSGLGDSEALHRLSILNERGRTYRFHHPLLS